ncbi:MAG: UDP-N-acetylmuramoyl-L-alanine--D-glutamate ligase [Vicinamibacteria bacterium]
MRGTSAAYAGAIEEEMEVAGTSAVVVGLARSGVAAARLLAARGARVTACDRKRAQELPTEVAALESAGVRLELGGHAPEALAAAALVVVSPGVPWELPELQAARARGALVLAELELGFLLAKGSVAAVTGTKGKSTTTAALGAMLRAAGGPAFADVRVGGNIGEAFCGLVEGSSEDTTFVIEASSFQLEGTSAFHPRLAVFLNFSPDHLDRHPSVEAYALAKARVFANQTSEDWAVVNADDARVMELARRSRARLLRFRGIGARPAGDAAWFDAERACVAIDGREETLFRLADVRLPGRHLASDLLAAGAAARLLGAPAEAVAAAVAGFAGVEHVLERVAEIGGVTFYDDSKATNVAAARMSLQALPPRVVAVMGGRYKGGDFAELGPVARERLRAIVAIGESRTRIAAALAGVVPVYACASLGQAVAQAFAAARPGDSVVLAPACSSFDMFADYAERGRAFKDEVRKLAAERGRDG